MPTFTTLENPQPPEWSTFSKLNKAKERHVPLNVEHDLPERGRERAKTSSSGMTSKEDSKSQKPQSRSSSAKKNTVCTYICRSTFSVKAQAKTEIVTSKIDFTMYLFFCEKVQENVLVSINPPN